MPTTVNIDPRVALAELTARTDAERAFYQNRCLLLAQEAFAQRETIKALEAEIKKLKPEPPKKKA
jgi:hypothetical protein